MGRKPKDPKKAAKNAAWRAFADYIKLRDCLLTTGEPDRGKCISCGKEVELGVYANAGHLVPGRRNAVLFDELGVNLQCAKCNKYLSGNTAKYRVALIKKIGAAQVEECEARAYEIVKFSEDDYRKIAKNYKEKYDELKANS